MFHVGRTAGWCAHIMEQKRLGKLVRPPPSTPARAPQPPTRSRAGTRFRTARNSWTSHHIRAQSIRTTRTDEHTDHPRRPQARRRPLSVADPRRFAPSSCSPLVDVAPRCSAPATGRSPSRTSSAACARACVTCSRCRGLRGRPRNGGSTAFLGCGGLRSDPGALAALHVRRVLVQVRVGAKTTRSSATPSSCRAIRAPHRRSSPTVRSTSSAGRTTRPRRVSPCRCPARGFGERAHRDRRHLGCRGLPVTPPTPTSTTSRRRSASPRTVACGSR